MFDHVSFINNTIIITTRWEDHVTEFSTITDFHLSNRLLNNTVFTNHAPGKYHGYGIYYNSYVSRFHNHSLTSAGYIVIWQRQAFFLQDGANPEVCIYLLAYTIVV